MATASRQPAADIARPAAPPARLEREPWCYEFFQAVRLLQAAAHGRAAVGGFAPPREEAVRFAAHNSAAFPASEIQSLDLDAVPPRLCVNFMGLTGPLGALPLHYTAEVIQQTARQNFALRDFLDLFNHRMISLFYRAWEKYRFPVTWEREGRDRVTGQVLSLLGLANENLLAEESLPLAAWLYYAGLLARRPRSAEALRQLLADFFCVEVAIEQFAGGWQRLPEENCSRFAESLDASERLGVGSMVGDEVWLPQSRVRIHLGPLPLAQYREFLPDGAAYPALRDLTRFFSNREFDCEARLILRREEVPACELGAGAPPRLGWLSWAKSRAMERDPAETVLQL